MRPHRFGLPCIRVLKQTDEHDGMVGEILPDAGQIRAHLDADLAQVRGRPDARPHQERGRMHAAGGEDDLARAEFPRLAADPCADADDAAPSNTKPVAVAPLTTPKLPRAGTAVSR